MYEGPLLELKVDAFEGFFNEPRYRFLRTMPMARPSASISGRQARHHPQRHLHHLPAPSPARSWLPDWILRAASIRIDNEEEVGQAEGAC
jgi:LPS-assembly protein